MQITFVDVRKFPLFKCVMYLCSGAHIYFAHVFKFLMSISQMPFAHVCVGVCVCVRARVFVHVCVFVCEFLLFIAQIIFFYLAENPSFNVHNVQLLICAQIPFVNKRKLLLLRVVCTHFC